MRVWVINTGETEMETAFTTRAGIKITGVVLHDLGDAETVQITKGKWKGKALIFKKADRE
jgi:hypothetical protein